MVQPLESFGFDPIGVFSAEAYFPIVDGCMVTVVRQGGGKSGNPFLRVNLGAEIFWKFPINLLHLCLIIFLADYHHPLCNVVGVRSTLNDYGLNLFYQMLNIGCNFLG